METLIRATGPLALEVRQRKASGDTPEPNCENRQPGDPLRAAGYRYAFRSKANFNKLWLPCKLSLWQMFSR